MNSSILNPSIRGSSPEQCFSNLMLVFDLSDRWKLPAISIDLIAKMKQGVKTFQDAGAEHAYCGDPAAATAAEGRDLVDRLAGVAFDTAREAWPHLFGGTPAGGRALS